ncbi:MAG TPA: universal stress protein [Acidobacteriota bacterium]|nr:universal stress protein [Acidobacteriota bacterium]
MLPIRKILCPTDFSDPSLKALEAAGELARHFSSELIILHVVPPIPTMAVESISPSDFDLPGYQKEVEISARKGLQSHVEKYMDRGLTVYGFILTGDAATNIVECAEQEQADLIVIATHGRTGLKRLMFGSVAEKVVRLAGPPVLSIRERVLL